MSDELKIPKHYGVKPLDRVGIALTGVLFLVLPVWWIWWTIVALWHHQWLSAFAAQFVPWIANWANTVARAYFLRDMAYWRAVQDQHVHDGLVAERTAVSKESP